MMHMCSIDPYAFILIHLDHAGLFDLNQLIKIIDLNDDLNQGKKITGFFFHFYSFDF